MKPNAPEQFRMTLDAARRLRMPPELATDESYGRNGLFHIPLGRVTVRCVVSDGEGWEHVSVSLPDRCPTWDEMCVVKEIFWGPDETVIQYHPAKANYVNHHKYCLHLWRPINAVLPIPPTDLVGPKA